MNRLTETTPSIDISQQHSQYSATFRNYLPDSRLAHWMTPAVRLIHKPHGIRDSACARSGEAHPCKGRWKAEVGRLKIDTCLHALYVWSMQGLLTACQVGNWNGS